MIMSSALGVKPALKFNPKQKFCYRYSQKKLPHQLYICKITYLPLQTQSLAIILVVSLMFIGLYDLE